MRRILLVVSLLTLFVGCGTLQIRDRQASTSTQAQSKSSSAQNIKGHQPISTSVYQKMLKVGMDMDWAKTPEGRYWARKWHDAGVNVPKLFKERGLAHVRIRVKDDVLTDPTLLVELQHLVDDAIEAGLIPIIAYQAKEFKNDPTNERSMQHVLHWWQKVAETFRDKPYTLAYDIVIETTGKVKKHNDALNRLYQRVVQAIHRTDPHRIVILAANKISSPYMLKALQIPEPSDYVMAEWHFYAAGPNKKPNKRGDKVWTTGTEYEKKLLTDRFDTAVAWQRKHIPTWVGAWMSNNFNHAGNPHAKRSDGAPAGGEYNIEEQAAFATFVARELQKRGIPYAVNSDTKFFDRTTNRWYPSMKPVLDAMIRRY